MRFGFGEKTFFKEKVPSSERLIDSSSSHHPSATRTGSTVILLKFYVDGLSQGRLDAWSDFEMMEYHTFTLP
jgi:hypothetical protein